ncbi:MAG: hypothetical protein JWN73_2644 [Betaproteobacteria bacterium]|nr:hypothetical protein [Betaproteobacteria bacterium]
MMKLNRQTKRGLAGAGLALLAGSAQAQDNLCPSPMTGSALATQMNQLNWPETEYVATHEPGMKKIYDKIPPNYMEQLKANPHALPWGQFAANRNQETIDRVAGLVRDARAQRLAGAFAAAPWPQVQKALAQDAELKDAAQKPRGTPLDAAQRDPKKFDWKGLLAQRDTCQLTAMLQVIQPDTAAPAPKRE